MASSLTCVVIVSGEFLLMFEASYMVLLDVGELLGIGGLWLYEQPGVFA